MNLGRLVSTVSLSAALLAAPSPTDAQAQQDDGRPDIEVCQASYDVNEPVDDAVQRGIRRSQYFFARHGFDLEPVKDGDCVDIGAHTVYDAINDAMPGRTEYDAHSFVPSHDTTGIRMANTYTTSMADAHQAAKDSLDTLPDSVAAKPRRDLQVLSKGQAVADSDPNSIRLSPYLLWTQAVRKTRDADIPREDQDEFIQAEISRYVSHELLHTFGLPHPWDWKTRGYQSENQTSNVMGYGRPHKYPYAGDQADSIYAYTMSNVQQSLLDDALKADTEYHALQDTTGLAESYDAFADHWEEAHPDATRLDYIGATPTTREDTTSTTDKQPGRKP